MYRQGDVIIERIDEIPSTAQRMKPKRGQRIVLAYGEATGHHHSIDIRDADWWRASSDAAKAPPPAGPQGPVNGPDLDVQFLDVKTSATVTHQEHAAIVLPAGKYRVIQQKEYSPEEIRRVAD